MKPLIAADGGKAVLDRAVQLELRDADGESAADLLYVLANVHEDQAPAYFSGAAAALRPHLHDHPERLKSNASWLARLMERGGDAEGAIAVLTEAAAMWSDEPTFHLALGGALQRAERLDEALAEADLALEAGWGDNRLRAAKLKADVLIALDRAEDARSLAITELKNAAPVEPDMVIRTFRYRAALQKIIDGEPEE